MIAVVCETLRGRINFYDHFPVCKIGGLKRWRLATNTSNSIPQRLLGFMEGSGQRDGQFQNVCKRGREKRIVQGWMHEGRKGFWGGAFSASAAASSVTFGGEVKHGRCRIRALYRWRRHFQFWQRQHQRHGVIPSSSQTFVLAKPVNTLLG